MIASAEPSDLDLETLRLMLKIACSALTVCALFLLQTTVLAPRLPVPSWAHVIWMVFSCWALVPGPTCAGRTLVSGRSSAPIFTLCCCLYIKVGLSLIRQIPISAFPLCSLLSRPHLPGDLPATPRGHWPHTRSSCLSRVPRTCGRNCQGCCRP